MASNPASNDPITPPDASRGRERASDITTDKQDDVHIEDNAEVGGVDSAGKRVDAHNSAGMAVIEQRHVIPATGKRMETSKWEYITFCIFYFSLNGAPIGSNGGALRQMLVNQQFPDGIVHWGGRALPVNAFLLNITGIMFAAQLVTLMILGPYADYGNWRPWIMIVGQCTLYIMQFALCGINSPSQWQAANAIFVVGSLAANIVNSFYAATFPGIVRDLPKLINSEQEVKSGQKSPEAHAELDSYERSKLYNLVNITGSGIVICTYAIAVGISAGIGFDTPKRLVFSYNVLMGYFGAITVICTVPFFLVHKHRPGQQLPAKTNFLTAGPKQVWMAMKSAVNLKQCLLYLGAYFLLHESHGTSGSVTGILQNEVIHYSPLKLSAMMLVADLSGGLGTVLMFFLQKKYRFSVKKGVFYGACMTLGPSLWGAIGYFTNSIGYHHGWEFWLVQVWNFQTAAWGSYQVTMISEVVPHPKAYMFFALFNTVSKTSGFIGPFISSAIIERAGGDTNAAYWFLFPVGMLGVFTLYWVDTDKAKIDNARYLEREADEYYTVEQRNVAKAEEMMEDEKVKI